MNPPRNPYRTLTVSPLAGALGAQVGGLTLKSLEDEAAWAEIRRAFAEYSVLVFRHQGIEPADQMRIGARCGPPCHYPFVTGLEEGVDMIGGSAIVAPTGEIVARCSSVEEELIVARCDLDLGRSYRQTTFDFAKHRRLEARGMIVERTGRKSP